MSILELAMVGLAGSAVGAALGAPMIAAHEQPLAVRYLGGWLVSLSAIIAVISARLGGWLPAVPAVNHAINLLGLCTYPLLYLYIRAAGDARPIRRAWRLWIPAAAYIATLPVLVVITGSSSMAFVWLLPVLLFFTGLCAVSALRPQPSLANDVVPPMWIVAFLVVINTAQIVRMLFATVPYVRALVPIVVTLGFLALVGRVARHAIARAGGPAVAAAGPRYEKSTLDADTASQLLARIDRALLDERLFADPQLSLARLAGVVGATPHQISEVLNRFASTSFNDRLTRIRLDDVKRQLADPSSDGFTIEGIGAAAGFGSRSALYAAFRKSEQMTPSAFRLAQRSGRT